MRLAVSKKSRSNALRVSFDTLGASDKKSNMSPAHSMLLAVIAAPLVVSCKRIPDPLTDAEACDKIAALPGSPWSAADKDNCYLTYGVVGPNVRTCVDGCVRRSPNAADFEDCRDDCTGAVYPSFMVCQKLTADGHRFDACREKHEPLISEAKDRYKCWSRCGRRAATAVETEACDRRCGVPD
jgi:hypothetical protein